MMGGALYDVDEALGFIARMMRSNERNRTISRCVGVFGSVPDINMTPIFVDKTDYEKYVEQINEQHEKYVEYRKSVDLG